jgi:hypothetical protein
MQLKKHVHAELIKEYARQLADGEIEANWWNWQSRANQEKHNDHWTQISSPSWLASMEYRFTKNENHPDFNLYISPGDSFEISVDRKTIVTMHLAGNLYKVCFTDQTGRYFIGVFDIEEFGAGVETKVPMSVIENWLNEKIIKETIVRCNRDYN